ncbi:MAG: hypothetical protein SNF33_05000 [Candidatus Algichlamydia australiensis]|nr:hypothetical protein [Chlamydiales bacterium]
MHHASMEQEKHFSQSLDKLILLLFDLRKNPKKANDPNILKETSEICIELEKISKETEKTSDESLSYDAHLIWNWLALPFALNDHEASLFQAAREYQEKESSLLSQVLKQILANSEQTDLILGDITEISSEIHKIIGNH